MALFAFIFQLLPEVSTRDRPDLRCLSNPCGTENPSRSTSNLRLLAFPITRRRRRDQDRRWFVCLVYDTFPLICYASPGVPVAGEAPTHRASDAPASGLNILRSPNSIRAHGPASTAEQAVHAHPQAASASDNPHRRPTCWGQDPTSRTHQPRMSAPLWFRETASVILTHIRSQEGKAS